MLSVVVVVTVLEVVPRTGKLAARRPGRRVGEAGVEQKTAAGCVRSERSYKRVKHRRKTSAMTQREEFVTDLRGGADRTTSDLRRIAFAHFIYHSRRLWKLTSFATSRWFIRPFSLTGSQPERNSSVSRLVFCHPFLWKEDFETTA